MKLVNLALNWYVLYVERVRVRVRVRVKEKRGDKTEKIKLENLALNWYVLYVKSYDEIRLGKPGVKLLGTICRELCKSRVMTRYDWGNLALNWYVLNVDTFVNRGQRETCETVMQNGSRSIPA
jgi:hypothetical protein